MKPTRSSQKASTVSGLSVEDATSRIHKDLLRAAASGPAGSQRRSQTGFWAAVMLHVPNLRAEEENDTGGGSHFESNELPAAS